jgi:tRNA U34 2-thiouridine synthase MnmA/TrmU
MIPESLAKVKALSLMSGGLDSMLAAKLIMEQGIEVAGISFTSLFFGAEGARRGTDELGIDLIVIDLSDDLLKVIQSPKHGYGKHMNPCIDCHALMFRVAGERMEELGASFIVSGEVVGQRPKSQMRFGLGVVERESGLTGYLLRPLSAKLLAVTVPETEGWVDREKLLGLHGRSRKPQMELADGYGIRNYATPAGGCLLTDENFSRGLKDLKKHGRLTNPEIRILSFGRQFRLSDTAKLVVGRNHAENEHLFELRPDDDILVKVIGHKGPVGVLSGDATDRDLELAGGVVARYSDTDGNERVSVRVWSSEDDSREIYVVPFGSKEVKDLAI